MSDLDLDAPLAWWEYAQLDVLERICETDEERRVIQNLRAAPPRRWREARESVRLWLEAEAMLTPPTEGA